MSIARQFQSELLQVITDIAMSHKYDKFDYQTYCETIRRASDEDTQSLRQVADKQTPEVAEKEPGRLPVKGCWPQVQATLDAKRVFEVESLRDLSPEGYWIRNHELE